MNLHEFTAGNGLIVEYEPIVTNLRIKNTAGTELFRCELIAAGLEMCRITLGSNQMSRPIRAAIVEYVSDAGFCAYKYERSKNGRFLEFTRVV
ncbi:hypothetical protein [Neptunicella sp.]|uniref:hypothetical protein n=1 Tax=Neptunicella sp. TaxID=2125986 RepID=UPI003F68BE51